MAHRLLFTRQKIKHTSNVASEPADLFLGLYIYIIYGKKYRIRCIIRCIVSIFFDLLVAVVVGFGSVVGYLPIAHRRILYCS